MHKIKAVFLITIALFAIGISSCKKKVKEDSTVYYWFKPFFAGNFTLNSKEIPMYNDASNNVQTANFFKKTEAPDGDFQQIGMRWYIPTDTTLYTTTISDPSSDVLINGVNVPISAIVSFQSNIVLDSIQYAIYKIEDLPASNTANKENLENIKFSAQISYTDGSGVIINRQVTSNIYKKDL